MATVEEKPAKTSGNLFKRQRGLKNSANNGDTRSLTFQKRKILLKPAGIEYYAPSVKFTSDTKPNGTFPIERIKIVEKVPDSLFSQKKYCFQVGDQEEVMYFKAKTEEKRKNWMTTFRLAAARNNNQMSKSYHDGAFGMLVNPPRWSCCEKESKESIGCVPCHPTSQTLPRGLEFPISISDHEDDLSDDEEGAMNEEYSQSVKSAPGELFFTNDQSENNAQVQLVVPPIISGVGWDRSSAYEQRQLLMRDQSFRSIDSGVGSRTSTFSHGNKAIGVHMADCSCQTDLEGDTSPIVYVVKQGDTEHLKALLDGQTDPNSSIMVNGCKTTVLSVACENGEEEIVNMLINSPEYKVDINCQDDTGRTPLMIAVMKGLLNIVKKLLKRGAKTNVKSAKGRTALHEAIERDDLNTIQVLLEGGADPLLPVDLHRPHDLAVLKGHKEVIKVLVQQIPRAYIPYSQTKSIDLQSHVKSLKFNGIHQAVALTDDKVSLVNLNLEKEEKCLSGSFTGLSVWDDSIVLGSERIQCMSIKNWDWILSYEHTQTKSSKCKTEEYLTAVTHDGKMVSIQVGGGALCTWEPALVLREHSHNGSLSQMQYNKTSQSQRTFTPSPHKVSEIGQGTSEPKIVMKVYSLSISMDKNAPYIAVGVLKHSEYQVLIYNYDKQTQKFPTVIHLGKENEHGNVIALSQHGRKIASGTDRKLEILTVISGEKLHCFSDFERGTYITSLIFPPYGTRDHLPVGMSTGNIHVFSQDLKSGPLFTLWKPSLYTNEVDPVTALAYSQDAQFLAAGHHHGALHVWSASNLLKTQAVTQMNKFVVGSEGGKYTSVTDGYSIVIQGGVLKNEITITHGIVPFEKCSLQFPDGIMPVSKVVSLCPYPECMVPLELSIQHWLDLDPQNSESLKALVVLKAHHNSITKDMDGTHQINFEVIEDARIIPSQNPKELTIQVAHCCAFCIGSYIKQKDTNEAIRFYLIELKPKDTSKGSWTVEYMLSYVFDTCRKEKDIQYPEKDYNMIDYTIEFSPPDDGMCPYIELQKIKYQEELGWKIDVLGSKQITRDSLYFWDYPMQELCSLQRSKKYPPRITLRIDGSRATTDVTVSLVFKGAILYPGKEALSIKLSLESPNLPTAEAVPPRPPAPTPSVVPQSSAQPQVSVIKHLRQNHVNLVGAFNSVEKLSALLHHTFGEGIIDDDTYLEFLTKLENPQCAMSIVSGRLLSVIYKHLEKNVDHFTAFCKCTHFKNANGMKKVMLEYKKMFPQVLLEAEEGEDNECNEPPFHQDEHEPGLLPAVRPFN